MLHQKSIKLFFSNFILLGMIPFLSGHASHALAFDTSIKVQTKKKGTPSQIDMNYSPLFQNPHRIHKNFANGLNNGVELFHTPGGPRGINAKLPEDWYRFEKLEDLLAAYPDIATKDDFFDILNEIAIEGSEVDRDYMAFQAIEKSIELKPNYVDSLFNASVIYTIKKDQATQFFGISLQALFETKIIPYSRRAFEQAPGDLEVLQNYVENLNFFFSEKIVAADKKTPENKAEIEKRTLEFIDSKYYQESIAANQKLRVLGESFAQELVAPGAPYLTEPLLIALKIQTYIREARGTAVLESREGKKVFDQAIALAKKAIEIHETFQNKINAGKGIEPFPLDVESAILNWEKGIL